MLRFVTINQFGTFMVNVYVKTIYVHELTTAITFGYFDAILKEFVGKPLKFLLDNGRHFISFRYVTGKS